MKKVIILNLIF